MQKFRSSEIGHSERVPCLASLCYPRPGPHNPGPDVELSLALPLPDDVLRVP